MSTIKANQWLNSDGTENYKCRAWVNFNGTGTVAIRASGNVSSITDNGTGDYTVNFTTAMPDANYCAVCSPDPTGDSLPMRLFTIETYGKTFQSCIVRSKRNDSTYGLTTDVAGIDVAIFR